MGIISVKSLRKTAVWLQANTAVIMKFNQTITKLIILELRKILNPFIFLIMFIDHRQFNDLVQIEYKVDNHNRQFQDKCADASQRNNDTPQSYRITQHSKFGVSACCEDSSYCHTVYWFSCYIIGTDQQHFLQISAGCRGEIYYFCDKWG